MVGNPRRDLGMLNSDSQTQSSWWFIGPVQELTLSSDFDKIMNINVRGVWLCMKYEIPQMLNNGSGLMELIEFRMMDVKVIPQLQINYIIHLDLNQSLWSA